VAAFTRFAVTAPVLESNCTAVVSRFAAGNSLQTDTAVVRCDASSAVHCSLYVPRIQLPPGRDVA